jgi:hypothetical protein
MVRISMRSGSLTLVFAGCAFLSAMDGYLPS